MERSYQYFPQRANGLTGRGTVRRVLLVCLGALVLVVAACARAGTPADASTPGSQGSDRTGVLAPTATVTYTLALPTIMAGPPPAGAACAAGDPNSNPPIYTHQVFRALSPDGYTFNPENGVLIDHASVPDGVIGPDGKQWVYFVNGEPGKHGIFVAREESAGNFVIVDCVKLDGRFEGNAVDPDIRRMEDGSYRLFYFLGSFVTPPDPNVKQRPIYSARSTDGVNFTIEAKVFEAEGITDPSVIKLADGSWLMALALTQQNSTMLARSADGMSFQRQDPLIAVPGIPELGLMADGSIRLYLSKSLHSTDGGHTWTQDPDRWVPSPDPSLVALPEGGYVMFYKKFPPPER